MCCIGISYVLYPFPKNRANPLDRPITEDENEDSTKGTFKDTLKVYVCGAS